MLVGKGTRQS
jgi:hypothetical protein